VTRATLVVVSGAGREVGLEKALDDMLGDHHPNGPLCDDAVVGWDDTMGPVSMALRERWPGVEWCPCRWRDAIQFAEHFATEDRWILWMLDDERLCRTGYPPYDHFVEHFGWASNGPVTPLRNLFQHVQSPNMLLGLYAVTGGVVFGEPRLWRAGFTWPSYVRPLLRVVGQDTLRLVKDHEAVAGLMFRRERFAASKGALVRLNVGGGERWWSGWINIDRDALGSPDILLDVALNTLPFRDGTVDAVVSSHMIDHLDLRAGRRFLEECWRVLKPGAPIRLAAEDLAVFFRKYGDGTIDDFAYFQPVEFAEYESAGIKAGMVMCGALGNRDWYSGHRQLYDGPGLCEMLEKVGFVGVRARRDDEYSPQFWDTDDIQPEHTVYIEGEKPPRPLSAAG